MTQEEWKSTVEKIAPVLAEAKIVGGAFVGLVPEGEGLKVWHFGDMPRLDPKMPLADAADFWGRCRAAMTEAVGRALTEQINELLAAHAKNAEAVAQAAPVAEEKAVEAVAAAE